MFHHRFARGKIESFWGQPLSKKIGFFFKEEYADAAFQIGNRALAERDRSIPRSIVSLER